MENLPDSVWETTTPESPWNEPMLQDIKKPIEHKHRILAFNFMLAGDFKKAYFYCKEGLKINPDSAFLYYIQGRMLGDLGHLEAGAVDLFKAVTLKPDFVDAYVELGYINSKLGDKKEAENCYSIAKQLNPNVKLPS